MEQSTSHTRSKFVTFSSPDMKILGTNSVMYSRSRAIKADSRALVVSSPPIGSGKNQSKPEDVVVAAVVPCVGELGALLVSWDMGLIRLAAPGVLSAVSCSTCPILIPFGEPGSEPLASDRDASALRFSVLD